MHIEGNATILAFGVFRGTVLLDTQWTTKLSLGQGYHTPNAGQSAALKKQEQNYIYHLVALSVHRVRWWRKCGAWLKTKLNLRLSCVPFGLRKLGQTSWPFEASVF